MAKNLYHDQDKLAAGQCQNYWGHGSMSRNGTEVQLCPCEFVAAGKDNLQNAKNYPAAHEMLSGHYVKEAEIIGSIEMPDRSGG